MIRLFRNGMWEVFVKQLNIRRKKNNKVRSRALLFFYDVQFQKIKVQLFYKIILTELCFTAAFEFFNITFQPDRAGKVEFVANSVQRMKDFMCSGIVRIILYGHIAKQVIIFYYFSPNPKHIFSS